MNSIGAIMASKPKQQDQDSYEDDMATEV